MTPSSSSPILVPTPPSSVVDQQSDLESASSNESFLTATRKDTTMASGQAPEDLQSKTSKRFGTALQQFSQDLTKSLSRYQISEKLTDKNFSHWSQPVIEALMSLDYVGYVKKTTFKDHSLSDEEHTKVKFILNTWMLSLMDTENVRRCRVHLTTRSNQKENASEESEDDSDDNMLLVMSYEPALLWKFLKSHHQAILNQVLALLMRLSTL